MNLSLWSVLKLYPCLYRIVNRLIDDYIVFSVNNIIVTIITHRPIKGQSIDLGSKLL